MPCRTSLVRRRFWTAAAPVVLLAALMQAALAEANDELADGFRMPPDAARPLTWWHWLNGAVTRDGITADLEAMKRAGLGGCYLFNCGGRLPEGDVRFLQPKWLEMMDHTIREAERLGLKFGVHNCDGFSQSGGPWIKPESSMKELTWTTRDVEGPVSLDATLNKPEVKEDFYQDIAVVAFPLPAGELLAGATLRGTLPPVELAKLTDGNAETKAEFPVPADQHAVEFVFGDPRTARSLLCSGAAPHKWEEDFPIRIEVSTDGRDFRPVGVFTANWDMIGGGGITVACEEATGTVFRLAFKNPWPVSFGEMELSSAAKAHFAEAKAGRLRSRGHGAETRHHRAYPGPDRHRPLAPGLVVARDSVCDLTRLMGADGRLKWDVPAGRWRIVRVGFTSNGHYVAPATAEGRGLECDKLDPAAIRFHLDQYVGRLLERAGPAAGKTLAAVEIDSWECGIQNWTAGFEDRFRQRVGYDLLPWLPALLEGWIVDDADRTDRMLWDWRRFLADQFSESYFAEAAKYFKAKGVTYIGESTGRQQYLYDVAYLRNSEVPMGEFWIDSGPGQGVRVDNKVASSVAHITGKKIVASESYTSSPGFARWQNHPFNLKAEGDRAFCAGVNQFVFHTFAHQPYPATGPGFTFFYWGLNFNRANTWWDAAEGWMAYLARCNHLLRQGQQVCDVLWFVGEDVPNRIAWRDELEPVLPSGYDFDGCDAGALSKARADRGRIVLPSGAEYRVLLLPDLPTMRPAIAKKILELTQAGAAVLAPRRPTQSPSLGDLGDGDAIVRTMAEELGNGPVASGVSFEDLFRRIDLPPDFEWRGARKDAEVLYVHRRTDGAEIYFLSNQFDRREEGEAVFRAGLKAPELWDPAAGDIVRPGVFRQEDDGRVAVPLRLDPNGSVFVVFREALPARHAVAIATRARSEPLPPTAPPPVELEFDTDGNLRARIWEAGPHTVLLNNGRRVELAAAVLPAAVSLDGPWQISFPPNLGAPAAATFDKLISWTEHAEPGIRFFSGTATYRKEFDLPASRFGADRALYLDLGRVEVIARVAINGQELPALWKAPFRVCVDGMVRPGSNRLEIRLTNLWPNRMIGDAALPDDIQWQRAAKGTALPARWPDWLLQGRPRPSGRIAFCTRKDVYAQDDPLLPSGLLGPVRIECAEIKPAPLTQ